MNQTDDQNLSTSVLGNLDDLVTPQSKRQQKEKPQSRHSSHYEEDSEMDEQDKLAFEERRQKYQEWVLKPLLMGMFGALGMSIGK